MKGAGRARHEAAKAKANRRPAEETERVRRWAIENGHEVAARGRIPGKVQAAYDEYIAWKQSA